MASRLIAEFPQTWILRILSAMGLIPLGMMAVTSSDTFLNIIGLLLFAGLIWLWLSGFKTKVELYPNKLVYHRLLGTVTVPLNAGTQFYYREVQVRVQGINAGQHTFITLVNRDVSVKLNSNIKDIDVLKLELTEIELKIAEPIVQQALTQKQTLSFGNLRLSGTGLAYKNRMVAFHEIDEVDVHNGFLVVRKTGNLLAFLKIAVSEIPNMTTFFIMLDHYRSRPLR